MSSNTAPTTTTQTPRTPIILNHHTAHMRALLHAPALTHHNLKTPRPALGLEHNLPNGADGCAEREIIKAAVDAEPGGRAQRHRRRRLAARRMRPE
ncbi:MAG: hypothetical protein Q9191_004783, partial [Dirinaria sp. TL-2023a]